MAVVIETTVGDFTVDLYTQERPQTCRNFLKLCKMKYYNWNLFFTVQSNFIAQTGDPSSTGKGGESVYGIIFGENARYYEAEQMPKLKHDKVGLLSMVNCGNKMLGSQFFITLANDLQSLDGEHCVFGEISEGLEIILKFNETICDTDHRPYQDIRISHTVILEDPYEDPKELVIPDRSPEPTKEALMSDRIGADETIDDTAGMSVEEIAEMQKEKEAKARATILEIVGDIPDAEMAPPENVLFVCKLNPVTNDDDLEIIFSRFGKIIGCEVIRDRQSGDSLQYAFIEFAERKCCEEAYFKMDNVLIDDRRIHVDFSQSIAKMRWRGKGKGIKYFDQEGKDEKKDDRKYEKRKKQSSERRSRSRSPRKEKRKYESYNYQKNDRKNVDDRYEKPLRKKQERSRSRSNENIKERQKSVKTTEINREKRQRNRETSTEIKRYSRERSISRRGKSRERSMDRRKRKEKNDQVECRKGHRDDYSDSRYRDEKKDEKKRNKIGHRRSEERDDRHSHSKKRQKSRDGLEEKHSRQHKYKNR